MSDKLQQILTTYTQFSERTNQIPSPTGLYEPVKYITDMGGKHMRPMLLLIGCSVYDENWEKGLSAAYGIEMFHNFTLVHDDIMDDADLRRGKPAVHCKYGVNQAILSGDVMLLKSLQFIRQSAPDMDNVINDFLQTGVNVCEGQQLDVDFETQIDPGISQYLEMIKGKTAVLPAEALRMGARIGGAPEAQAERLFAFGVNLGLAFQIQDDILDAFGEQAQVGKIVGGDIRQNKKTALYLLTLDQASSEDERQRFIELYNKEDQSDRKVEDVKRMILEIGGKRAAEQLKEEYHQASQTILEELSEEGYDLTLLKEVSKLLLDRVR